MVSYEGASHSELKDRLSLLMLPTLWVFSSCLRGREAAVGGGVLVTDASGEKWEGWWWSVAGDSLSAGQS